MARSLNIPAMSFARRHPKLETGQHVLLMDRWLLIVDPAPETLAHYTEVESKRAGRGAAEKLRETRSTTRVAVNIVLSANIELPEDVDAVAANGAEESDFIARNSFI